MRATYSPSTRGMHHMSLRHGLRSFSDNRRRTVSPDRLSCSVSLTIASAKRSSVQRARPSGGLAQAVATSRASSLPVSLRSAPGRGSSLSARSRLPSTKRRLVRYTVEPLTATAQAISSSLRPASAASRICARLSLRTARLPLLNIAVSSSRSAWLNSTRYRTFIAASFVGGPDESTDESKIRRRPSYRPAKLHRQARPVSGFHLRLFAHVPPAASRNRHAAPLPRQPTFGPPDGRHPLTKWIDPTSTRCRSKHRTPRASRSTAHPRMARNQPVKITVTRYQA